MHSHTRRIAVMVTAILMGAFTLIGIGGAMIPQSASAGTNGGSVVNKTKHNITVWCDYGNEKTKHTLKPGQDSEAWSRCRLDTDQARDAKKACITVGGLGAIYKRVNGTWQVPAGRKIKVVGVSTVRYYEYTKSKCGNKKVYPLK